jgi:type III restriction enzyme
MELKQYQVTTLTRVRQYLELLAKERESGNAKHASMDAWEALGLKGYQERKNGMGEDLPNFCLKIPTGGGKTLLAVKSLDIINAAYRKKADRACGLGSPNDSDIPPDD